MRGTYLTVAALGLLACGDSFIASGDPSGVGGSTSSAPNGGQGAGAAGGSTSNGGGPCESSEIFVPDVPADWDGYTIISSQTGETCPDGSDSDEGIMNLGVPPDCDCGCNTFPQHCFASISLYGDGLCNTPATAGPLIYHGTCLPNPASLDGANALFTTSNDEGLCSRTGAPALRELQFDSVSTCDAQVSGECMEAPGSSFPRAVCVSQSGVQTCPDDFPLEFIVGRGLQDTRVCNNDCACAAQNLECKGEIVFFEDDQCNNDIGSLSHEVCGPTASGTEGVRYDAAISGSCNQAQGAGTYDGQASVDSVETICCTAT